MAEVDHASPSASKREHGRMCFIARRREHGDLAGVARHERKTVLGRVDACQRAQRLAQAADLDTQPCAMRFIGVLGAERTREQRGPRHVAGPGFGQRAGESEEDRARLQRNRPCRCGR